MSDMSQITQAIETSNKAFEEFKKINDERLARMEKGHGGADELKASMEKAFTDMADQKKTIETMEAKMKRPALGDQKPVDEAVSEHTKSFNQYIRKGIEYDKALEMKAMSIGSGPDGGFAVPKIIDGMIDDVAVNVSPIRSIANVVQISTSDYHKLVNLHGTASGWVGETQARAATTTPTMADIVPPMGELYANPQVTQQMLDDVFFNAETWLADNVGIEFGRAEGAAFVSGTGVNQPRGFLSGAAPVATADATRAFGTLEFVGTGSSGAWKTLSATVNPADDLYSVAGKIKALYRRGSVWVIPKSILFDIMSFKDYQGRYVFSPTTAPGLADTILGYPVVEAEDMPAKAANSFSVAFGNFNLGYIIVDRIGTRVIRDPFSNKPYIGFYTTKRVGGAVVNSEAIKLIKFSS